VTRPFRFGLQAMDLGDHEAVADVARRAEAIGFDDLWSYDHLGAIDPFVPLVVAAEATTRLRIGPLVLNNELHHPALLARTAATVDRFSGGRLVLGMGTGYMQPEHDATGIELRPPGDRVDRLEESLVALRQLLDDGRCHLDGTHHHLAIDDLGVRPIQGRVPILVGGHGRRVVGVAGRHADLFQFTGLTHAPDGTPQPGGFAPDDVALRAVWLTEAAGDREADIERSVLVQATHVGDGADRAIGKAAERLGADEDLVTSTPFLLMGSLEQIVDELGRMREAYGISHVVVRDAEGFAPVVEALAGR
jgi:probable F420-dependent oxidoreductase